MHIVADANILSVQDCFAGLGELELVDGRDINRQHLQHADVLLVRSITRVDEALLENTPVQFVGSATSGIDHVDVEYLKSRGIAFADARGSNARAVVDYCFSALAWLRRNRDWNPFLHTVGIFGAGRVGGLLARSLSSLGVQCVAFDPFLDEREKHALRKAGIEMVTFDEALQADAVSFHVPLTRSGTHPTFHQLSPDGLQRLKKDCVLINASRGSVIDNLALLDTLKKRDDLAVVLDVWEGEPDINRELLERVVIGSPHIAGYSVEAKLNATVILLQQTCDHFNIAGSSPINGIIKKPVETSVNRECEPTDTYSADSDGQVLQFDGAAMKRMDDFCSEILLSAFPLADIDRQLRREFGRPDAAPATIFDHMRKRLAARREFSAFQIGDDCLSPIQRRLLQVLGFQLTEAHDVAANP